MADNKLALNAGWDVELLGIELQGLIDLDFDVSLTGFSLAEIDLVLDGASEASERAAEPADVLPEPPSAPVSQRGDIWLLGRHRLICGDAREAKDFEALLEGAKVDLIFTDPPYHVPIDGHVSGLGKTKHREFAMASGEMSKLEFTGFLHAVFAEIAEASQDGALVYSTRNLPGSRVFLKFTMATPPGEPAHEGLGKVGKPQLAQHAKQFKAAAKATARKPAVKPASTKPVAKKAPARKKA